MFGENVENFAGLWKKERKCVFIYAFVSIGNMKYGFVARVTRRCGHIELIILLYTLWYLSKPDEEDKKEEMVWKCLNVVMSTYVILDRFR